MNPTVLARYLLGSSAYGFTRAVMYSTPMKSDDYFTDRFGRCVLSACIAPFVSPMYLATDIHNLEHVIRKMPGKLRTYP